MTLISDNKHNKVMLFIDLRNVLESVNVIEKSAPFALDLYTMAVQLVGSRELVAAYAFDTRKPFGVDDNSARFHDRLRYLGFRVIARESYDPVKKEQKEVDVAMACEMVVHALRNSYDIAIVVSGDQDFVPAIQHVQAAGKRVEVAAFDISLGKALMKAADRFHDLDKIPLLSMSNPSEGLAEIESSSDGSQEMDGNDIQDTEKEEI
jgi:uncharacterized LabA/DUF88 family protein